MSESTTETLIKRMLAATAAEVLRKHEDYNKLFRAAQVAARPSDVTDGRVINLNGDLRRLLENAGL